MTNKTTVSEDAIKLAVSSNKHIRLTDSLEGAKYE